MILNDTVSYELNLLLFIYLLFVQLQSYLKGAIYAIIIIVLKKLKFTVPFRKGRGGGVERGGGVN